MNKLHLILISLFAPLAIQAQCDGTAAKCAQHISEQYISDGQSYRALLNGPDIAEFRTTLFGGNTYRVAACTGETDGAITFRLYDQDRNLLFTSADFGNSPYWDFALESTMLVTIEASLDETRVPSGCAVLVIGFKK